MIETDASLVDYIDVAEWRTALQKARIEHEAAIRDLTERINAEHEELARIESDEQLLAQAARHFAARTPRPTTNFSLAGNSLREILIINFADDHGLILGRQSSASLHALGYFTSRRSADGAVYTALGKAPFVRLDRGTYLILTDSSEWARLRLSIGNHATSTSVPYSEPIPLEKSLWARQLEAVVSEAQKHDGLIRAGDAAKTLRRSRLYRNPNTIGLAANGILQRKKLFVKVERGLYMLLKEPETSRSLL
jgi:hypothetical protein